MFQKYCGLLLFFMFYLSIICIDQTELPQLIHNSHVLKLLMLAAISLLVLWGWVALIVQAGAKLSWRRVTTWISAVALSASLLAEWANTTVVPHWLGWWLSVAWRFMLAPGSWYALFFRDITIL